MKVLILLLLFNREQIAEAQHHGEKCAKPRIIELMESQACNVECKSPGKEFSFSPNKRSSFQWNRQTLSLFSLVDCKVGPWEEWSSCSVTCGEGTRERGRLNVINHKYHHRIKLMPKAVCSFLLFLCIFW